ncbi:hypothetical protein BCD64_24990 [Nostoc sp. MBR 210]|nr:hypothetical protein BCD64_24990 [Nostoc sp. MBR 210]
MNFKPNVQARHITQQKTKKLFWRGFGGRLRPPIGGVGENPPNLSHALIGRVEIEKLTLIILTKQY